MFPFTVPLIFTSTAVMSPFTTPSFAMTTTPVDVISPFTVPSILAEEVTFKTPSTTVPAPIIVISPFVN